MVRTWGAVTTKALTDLGSMLFTRIQRGQRGGGGGGGESGPPGKSKKGKGFLRNTGTDPPWVQPLLEGLWSSVKYVGDTHTHARTHSYQDPLTL